MSTEMKTGWCCPVAGRWALIRREWLRHWQSVVQISMVSGASIGAFNGAIIAASRSVRSCRTHGGALIIWE